MSFLKNRIVFRADGNSRIGLGHVMRCVALSEMLNSDFECVFIISNPSDSLRSIIKSSGELIALNSLDINDELLELSQILRETDIVVVDGYLFDETYLEVIKTKTHKLVVIDDFAEGYFNSAIVLNHANEFLFNSYKKSKETKILCGFDYLVLRQQFLHQAKVARFVAKVDTAFICMGGADPTNVTIKVLQSCIQVNFIKNIVVVSGAAYPHQNELTTFIEKYKGEVKIVNHVNIDAAMMVNLILDSQICICPASSIALEVCCVKSALLTGMTIDNQKLIHEQLLRTGCADSIGNFNSVTIEEISAKLQSFKSPDLVSQMMHKQFSNIDGKSAGRILDEFKLLI